LVKKRERGGEKKLRALKRMERVEEELMEKDLGN